MKIKENEIFIEDSEINRELLTAEEHIFLCGTLVRLVTICPKVWAFLNLPETKNIFTRIGAKLEDENPG